MGLLLTDEYYHHPGGSIMSDLVDPVRHRFESGPACDVIGYQRPMGAAVVTLGDGAETLLTGRVPNLHLK
jgi:hypothetical protein